MINVVIEEIPDDFESDVKGTTKRYKSMGEVSDDYHTFNELYEFRKAYNALLFNEWRYYESQYPRTRFNPVKSKRHSDGELCFGGGWFVVSAETRCGQITNHYEMKDWDLFRIPEVEKAPKWDGHTPQQALERLLNLAKGPEEQK